MLWQPCLLGSSQMRRKLLLTLLGLSCIACSTEAVAVHPLCDACSRIELLHTRYLGISGSRYHSIVNIMLSSPWTGVHSLSPLGQVCLALKELRCGCQRVSLALIMQCGKARVRIPTFSVYHRHVHCTRYNYSMANL